MPDDMSTIPPRVNEVEREVHTLKHRVSTLEDTHKDSPLRLTRLESAINRLPEIERQLSSQGDQIRKGFNTVNGAMIGAGALWVLLEIGPKLLKVMGGS